MKIIFILLALLSFNVFAAPVDINKADAKTLSESLKGIGMKKAEAIVKYRSKNGPFKSIDDLRKVKGIGEQTIKTIAADTGLSNSKTKAVKKTKDVKSKKITKETKKKEKQTKEKTSKKSTDKKSK